MDLRRMTLGKQRPRRNRRVGRRLAQARLVNDFSLHPRSVGLSGDGLDDEAKQTITMVRIFEARVRVDGRGLLQIGNQLLATKKRPSALELASIQAVANDPCTMGAEFA